MDTVDTLAGSYITEICTDPRVSLRTLAGTLEGEMIEQKVRISDVVRDRGLRIIEQIDHALKVLAHMDPMMHMM